MRALFVLALALTTTATAQPGWRAIPADRPTVSVDVLTAIGDDPSFVATDDQGNQIGVLTIGTVSMTALLGVRVPVGQRLRLVGEVPVGYTSFTYPELLTGDPDFFVTDSDDVALGNPYLGVEMRAGPAVTLGAGLRLPLADAGDFTQAQGWQGGLAAETERFEAYLPDTFTASASVAVAPALREGLRARVRLEPALLVPTGDDTDSGIDLALGALLGLDARVGRATLSGSVLTRRTVTKGRFGDLRGVGVFEVDATVTLGATMDLGGVRPGLDLRVPLYETLLQQDATVGLRVDVPLR